MNWKTIFNPFEKYSETALLVAGLIAFAGMNAACLLVGNMMDGVLHWEDAKDFSVQKILVTNGGILLSTIVLFFIFGKIINRNTRLVDVANAFLLSLIPSTLVLLWGKIPAFDHSQKNIAATVGDEAKLLAHSSDLALGIFSALVALPLIVYIVILMYNGFKIATNMKKTWQIIVFFLLLFIFNSITQMYF